MARKDERPIEKNRPASKLVEKTLQGDMEQKELAAAWERGYSQKGVADGHAWRRNALDRANVDREHADKIARDDSHAFRADDAQTKGAAADAAADKQRDRRR
jgi:hypothetical protein